MGDSYASGEIGRHDSVQGRRIDGKPIGKKFNERQQAKLITGLKPKDLCGQPWRLAFALQDDGWYLRQDIIWAKPNPMPESVTDRCTKSHEYVFLLTKNASYWYDADAIREPAIYADDRRAGQGRFEYSGKWNGDTNGEQRAFVSINPAGRNKRSVWTIPTEPNGFAHFATFPQALIEPMILAGCPKQVCSVCGAPYVRVVEATGGTIGHTWVDHSQDVERGVSRHGSTKPMKDGSYQRLDKGFHPTCDHAAPMSPGIVLDMFMGSGTTALVARRLGRDYIGSEINPEYAELARTRLLHGSPDELKAVLSGEPHTIPMFGDET